jgi:hypothetical protein
VQFSWDPSKARTNVRKHDVSFEEAATVFTTDPLARIHDDPDHSVGEVREIIVGFSSVGRLLLVSFTERDGAVRIINARIADPSERKRHEENSR